MLQNSFSLVSRGQHLRPPTCSLNCKARFSNCSKAGLRKGANESEAATRQRQESSPAQTHWYVEASCACLLPTATLVGFAIGSALTGMLTNTRGEALGVWAARRWKLLLHSDLARPAQPSFGEIDTTLQITTRILHANKQHPIIITHAHARTPSRARGSESACSPIQLCLRPTSAASYFRVTGRELEQAITAAVLAGLARFFKRGQLDSASPWLL